MSEMDPGGGQRERSSFPAAFAAGVIVMLLVVGGVLLLTRSASTHGPNAVKHLPFGPAEQAYAPQVHFQNLQLAHSENLLNQEFIYVTGSVSNDGSKTVRALEMTLEFHDPFNQVILRETQEMFGPTAQPLKGGQQRDFQVTLERRLPAEWNQQYPSIRVTGLILE